MGAGGVSPTEESRKTPAPFWFLDELDFQTGEAVFIQAGRADLSRAIFLDQRGDRAIGESLRIPVSGLKSYGTPSENERPPAIIWHTSFCCSTLIAACLDWPGFSLAVKEPRALVELASARLEDKTLATDELVGVVIGALGRSPTPTERVVLKPSNGANTLISTCSQIAEPTGQGPMLMLYSSCRDYLNAVAWGGPIVGGADLRKGAARSLLAQRALAVHPRMRWTAEDLCSLTDFQAAALLWHVQVAEMRAAVEALGRQRVRSLDCAQFLADPSSVLSDIDAFFDLHLGPARVAEIVASSKLHRYAKKPDEVFDAARRQEIFRRVDKALGPTLDAIVAWSYALCPETPRGDPIGQSVMGCGGRSATQPGVSESRRAGLC